MIFTKELQIFAEESLSLLPGLERQHQEGGQPVGARVVAAQHVVLAGPAAVGIGLPGLTQLPHKTKPTDPT